MKATTGAALCSALLAFTASAHPADSEKRDVYTNYPYEGPAVPVGDWVDPTINGNGKGFPRLSEPPAVKPSKSKPSNNINVVSVSYIPDGVNIHYQTPFGLGKAPTVKYGYNKHALYRTSTGKTSTYDRTPPCSEVVVTMCSQFFHDIQLTNLRPGQTYHYQIPAANGTTESQVMSFKTSPAAGTKGSFSVAVLNDMGYTNAHGTHQQISDAVASNDVDFAWHGGDISYADDWYSGILPCELTGPDAWPLCYNGTSTELPNTPPAPFPSEYAAPLPAGEIPNQGGPEGGDISVIYESNWDLWQQWMNVITMGVPYMTLPGNHEAACSEFDGPGNIMTAYLNENKTNSTAPESELTYYSCPPSQRNFTTYQHRFRMPGEETGGVSNFWYSFDYGLAHFISLDSETDFAYSPEWPFIRDTKGDPVLPAENETYVTDSGPFGRIDNNDWANNSAYQQIQWLKDDLAAVDRSKTPWVFAMAHRPMYSSQVSSYQSNVRAAFEPLFLEYGIDAYFAGHIHWYERFWPLGKNGTIETENAIDNNTYYTGDGKSIAHFINGMAGNIESHSFLGDDVQLNITKVLNQQDYGFSKLTIHNSSVATWAYTKGADGSIGDMVTMIKKNSTSSSGSDSSSTAHWGGKPTTSGGWW